MNIAVKTFLHENTFLIRELFHLLKFTRKYDGFMSQYFFSFTINC